MHSLFIARNLPLSPQRATTSRKGIWLLSILTAYISSNPPPPSQSHKICLLCAILLLTHPLRVWAVSLIPNKPFFLPTEWWIQFSGFICPSLYSPLHTVGNNHINRISKIIDNINYTLKSCIFINISQLERKRRALLDLLVFIKNEGFIPLRHPFSMSWHPLYHRNI